MRQLILPILRTAGISNSAMQLTARCRGGAEFLECRYRLGCQRPRLTADVRPHPQESMVMIGLINSFNECQLCGDCCKTPCDLIPSDLPPLLKHFGTSLPEFFKKNLIALVIASPKYSDEVLMMAPVRMGPSGIRVSKYLADSRYLNAQSKCIFLVENKCSINNFKPFGGRFLQCPKMTGSISIQLRKSQYFAYWVNNQHLFELIFPGFSEIFRELQTIYKRKNEIFEKQKTKTKDYDQLHLEQVSIIAKKLFPLFNNREPEDGFSALCD